MAVWLPQGRSSNAINFHADVLQNKHVCSRECDFEKICGNVWRCRTSFHVHICDTNCDQRLPVDNYSEVCRLSKQMFTRTTQPMGVNESRKRSCGDDVHHSVKRQNSSGQPLMELPAWDVQARCAFQQQAPPQQQCVWNVDASQQSMCWQQQPN